MNTINFIKKIIPATIKKTYSNYHTKYLLTHPKYAIGYYLKNNTGIKMDFKHPTDLNQKINWLKLYGDTSRWPMLADKWAVRHFVEEQGLADILVKNYGHWNDATLINFNELKYPCVIKTNHGSGMNMFLQNKPAEKEVPAITEQLNNWLHTPFADSFVEPHYSKIKPCLLAEELLVENKPISTSIVDYKVFAFDGEVVVIWACCNRTQERVEVAAYDLNWNFHPEYSVFNEHYAKGEMSGKLPKPLNLKKMIEAASKLSKGEPQARIDFYEGNGKLYFGEITMTSQGGYMSFFTHDFLLKLGKHCKLPTDK